MYIIDRSDKLGIGQEEHYFYFRRIVSKTFVYIAELKGAKERVG